MKYQNSYGTLVVEPVSPLMLVRNIRGVDFPDDIKFDVDTAAKIALITENNRTQLAFQPWTAAKDALGYLIVHETPDTARVVRIVSMDYTGPEPHREIENCRRVTSGWEYAI
jgi:hypothetical protein